GCHRNDGSGPFGSRFFRHVFENSYSSTYGRIVYIVGTERPPKKGHRFFIANNNVKMIALWNCLANDHVEGIGSHVNASQSRGTTKTARCTLSSCFHRSIRAVSHCLITILIVHNSSYKRLKSASATLIASLNDLVPINCAVA